MTPRIELFDQNETGKQTFIYMSLISVRDNKTFVRLVMNYTLFDIYNIYVCVRICCMYVCVYVYKKVNIDQVIMQTNASSGT